MQNYIDSLNWRYAVKKYDATKKVSTDDLEYLKEAIRLSVSSLGLQPYKIFVIETQTVKEHLAEAAGGNNKNIFADASHLFVFANELNVDDKHADAYIDNISEQRGVAKEALSGFSDYIKGYLGGLTNEQKNIWTSKQTYIALSTLINTAALLKIDATPMEGFDGAKIDEILGLSNQGLSTTVVAAIGYRHGEDAVQHAKKVRKPKKELYITL
jgi:nitroreductase